jgi:excisionase family DNA binding protein
MGVDSGVDTKDDRSIRQARLKKHLRPAAGQLVAIDPDTRSRALVRVAPPELVPPRSDVSNGLEAAFLAFLQSKCTSGSAVPPAVPLQRRVFLAVNEAGEFSGLPVVFLRRLIASGKLKALRTGAGWRIPRAELERLSDTLTSPAEAANELSEHELRDIELNRLRRQGIAVAPAPFPEFG